MYSVLTFDFVQREYNCLCSPTTEEQPILRADRAFRPFELPTFIDFTIIYFIQQPKCLSELEFCLPTQKLGEYRFDNVIKISEEEVRQRMVKGLFVERIRCAF